MPEVFRLPVRMDCSGGLDLVHPIDRMPLGSFPYLFNARVLQEGIIEGRPGYTQYIKLADPPNSIRVLNDPAGLYAPNQYTYVGGGGSNLYAGIPGSYAPVDGGYSGLPLSLIPFRPDQSPESWMYVYDQNKQCKVRPDGVVRQIGVAPPSYAPSIELGVPAWVQLNSGQSTSGWGLGTPTVVATTTGTTVSGNINVEVSSPINIAVGQTVAGTGIPLGTTVVAVYPTLVGTSDTGIITLSAAATGSATVTLTFSVGGAATALSTFDRTNTSAPTITSIQYNSGNTGWACIQPNITQPFWMGQWMQVVLNAETVVVREIHNAITASSIQAIQYDTGSTGACSIVLAGSPIDLARNSLIVAGGETIRVLAVIPSPDGTVYSIRCSTIGTHVAGESITGVVSWYVYTVQTHVAGESITSVAVSVTQDGAGAGAVNFTGNINGAVANGRPIDPANDWLHLSIFLQNPQNVISVQLLLTLDATPNFSLVNPGNSYLFTVGPEQFGSSASGDSWAEILVPISSGVRTGNDLTRNLSNISGLAIQVNTPDVCSWGFDWWYLYGTYGPTIQPNSPTGYQFQTRFRDSSTGAASVPGPLNRYQLFPLRESVIITPQYSTQAGIDTIDINVIGGTIGSPFYAASMGNSGTFLYTLTDFVVLEIDTPADTTLLQPWTLLVSPWAGTVLVVGTSVIWISGQKFNTALVGNTAININGNVYLTDGQPRSSTFLELTQDAGYMATASFQVASPELAGQSLPYAFGALEGPFAPLIFALGDVNNAGVLYFSNFSNADGASDQNNLELSSPSDGLVAGAVFKSMAFAGTRDDLFCIRFSYLTTIGASSSTSFQWNHVDAPSGIWSRWACCSCPIGVAYLGRDGLYIATDAGGVNITDEKLYPLFPHEGQPATPTLFGANVIYPVDMTQTQYLRLSYVDEALHFCYKDTVGNWLTLRYDISKKRFLPFNYSNSITYHYLVEGMNVLPNNQDILMLAQDSQAVELSGGTTDNGNPINTIVLTPSSDGGDERAQKLYVDAMTQADGTGTVDLALTYNNATIFSPVSSFNVAGPLIQALTNIASLANLALYRNVGCKYAWTGGPGGPRLYAFEASGFLQPYLSTFFVTQFIALSFPGWKHMRRVYPALISNAPVLLTIKTQDDRVYGPYTIPSTGGQYRQLPQMLDRNIKDLALAFQLDGQGTPFAIFMPDFVVEVKEWNEETFVKIAVFKS